MANSTKSCLEADAFRKNGSEVIISEQFSAGTFYSQAWGARWE